MTSSAFKDLGGRLDEVRLLSRLDPMRAKEGVPDSFMSNAISRSCLVLLSAHLEGFLEDIVVEALDSFTSLGASVEQLPLVLRALHTEAHLKQIEPMKDARMRAPRIEKMFEEESALWIRGAPLQRKMIRAKMVCGEMNNPGSRETRQFLSLLGVDFETYLDTVGDSGLLVQLNGLVSRRNAVAHGEVNASATFKDVDEYVAVVERLSGHVDKAVAHAVQAVCRTPTLPW